MGAFGQRIRVWNSTPRREQVQAGAARRESLTKVVSTVAGFFAELCDPANVADRVQADTTLTFLQRRAALQLVL